ncbi:hypothetical protein EJ04DRAFT_566942 [Polyplosphaeria fusca]|uniref:Cyclin N-terminal domain-containing protein n=1 Tax=Polyplosphaeria fusca TaxID=682080 RepID=A0A9P4QUQ4_9PLEO|nr:hypothetical protein EJ04DRAFT_566942 [Polyplosphaeria fusca]
MDYSPALSIASVEDMTDEELDKYFASYEPLSNLPTPPPANMSPVVQPSHANMTTISTRPDVSPELEVYAAQLANLVPTNASPLRASTATLADVLGRANLPVDLVAFAACVLDALTSHFVTSWRTVSSMSCPSDLKLGPLLHCHQAPLSAELIVIAALSLAEDFTDDASRSNRHWAMIEAQGIFTARQIDMTKTCILQDMDYGLHRISSGMIQRMVRMLELPTDTPTAPVFKPTFLRLTPEKEERKPKLCLGLHGAAVWMHGMQTPEPSP